MSFDANTKEQMFIESHRICCLCYKQCGTNIEAAHIVQGGGDEFDNGIPVCLDCHQEIGAYDDKHPKGNKFRPTELRTRRDFVYRLVQSGEMAKTIIGMQHTAATPGKQGFALPQLPNPGETIITREDVVELFKAIPEFSEVAIRNNLDECHFYLRRNGVLTRRELVELVQSKEHLDVLRRLYHEHLKRPAGNNLDPLAVATWGAALYVGAGSPATITAIRQLLDFHYNNGAR